MLRYLGGRFFSGLLTLFLFVTLLFFIVSVVLPGDWTSQFILTAEGKMTLQEALGLDRPLGEQYVDWISGILVLDLGTSFTGPPVWDMILWALPSTLFVLVVGVGLAFLLGSYLGRASAYGDRPLASGGLTFVSVLCLTVFPPAIAVAILQGGEAWLGFVEFAELRNIEHPLFLDGTYDPRDVLWQMLGVLVASLLIVFAVKWFIARYLRRRVPGWLSLLLVVAIPLGVWRLVGISGSIK